MRGVREACPTVTYCLFGRRQASRHPGARMTIRRAPEKGCQAAPQMRACRRHRVDDAGLRITGAVNSTCTRAATPRPGNRRVCRPQDGGPLAGTRDSSTSLPSPHTLTTSTPRRARAPRGGSQMLMLRPYPCREAVAGRKMPSTRARIAGCPASRKAALRSWSTLTIILDTGIFYSPCHTRLCASTLVQALPHLFAYTRGCPPAHQRTEASRSVASIDNTYLDWADRNMRLNGLRVATMNLFAWNPSSGRPATAGPHPPRPAHVLQLVKTDRHLRRAARPHRAHHRPVAPAHPPQGEVEFRATSHFHDIEGLARAGVVLTDITAQRSSIGTLPATRASTSATWSALQGRRSHAACGHRGGPRLVSRPRPPGRLRPSIQTHSRRRPPFPMRERRRFHIAHGMRAIYLRAIGIQLIRPMTSNKAIISCHQGVQPTTARPWYHSPHVQRTGPVSSSRSIEP